MAFALPTRIAVAPGIFLWPGALDPSAQSALIEDVFARAADAPFYRPVMPVSGKAFSVEETNFGPLGWYSDKSGYRYEALHPETHRPWPDIPPLLLSLWQAIAGSPPPECCLVNLYSPDARMGLHQDRDEAALDMPVVSVSLGCDALFRIGGTTRKARTQSLKFRSGDVLSFGGPARLAFHGIDRVIPRTAANVPGGGRLNLTLRYVTGTARTKKDARPGG